MTLGIKVKIFNTVGIPKTNGSLILKSEEGMANRPNDLNFSFLQKTFILKRKAK